MENVVEINKAVNVVAFYFKNAGQRLKCFPKRIEYDGKRVDFTETGKELLAEKNQKLVHLFEMTDGQTGYQLEFDEDSRDWKLLTVIDSSRAIA